MFFSVIQSTTVVQDIADDRALYRLITLDSEESSIARTRDALYTALRAVHGYNTVYRYLIYQNLIQSDAVVV